MSFGKKMILSAFKGETAAKYTSLAKEKWSLKQQAVQFNFHFDRLDGFDMSI